MLFPAIIWTDNGLPHKEQFVWLWQIQVSARYCRMFKKVLMQQAMDSAWVNGMIIKSKK